MGSKMQDLRFPPPQREKCRHVCRMQLGRRAGRCAGGAASGRGQGVAQKCGRIPHFCATSRGNEVGGVVGSVSKACLLLRNNPGAPLRNLIQKPSFASEKQPRGARSHTKSLPGVQCDFPWNQGSLRVYF